MIFLGVMFSFGLSRIFQGVILGFLSDFFSDFCVFAKKMIGLLRTLLEDIC